MKVLVITGDKNFSASARYALQSSQVEKLDVVYWGRGNLRPTLQKESYDVVTAQDPFWRGLLAWRIARRTGAKANIQIHTDLDACSLVRRLFARVVLRRADSIRVVSEKIKKQVERIGVRAPIRVLPIFVDIERFRALLRRPHAGKTILWFGRFEPEKDPLRAVAVLKETRSAGIDARLIMLGAGSMEKEVRKKAAKLPIEFPGWRDPLPYLETADVVVSTSLHESWGASIVESLAAGVPVVAPDVGIAEEAGAHITKREALSSKVIEVLQTRAAGRLLLNLPSAQEWARQWRNTLI